MSLSKSCWLSCLELLGADGLARDVDGVEAADVVDLRFDLVVRGVDVDARDGPAEALGEAAALEADGDGAPLGAVEGAADGALEALGLGLVDGPQAADRMASRAKTMSGRATAVRVGWIMRGIVA